MSEQQWTPEEIRAPGWYRKGWTAQPEKGTFTSEWGMVYMSTWGWLAIRGGDIISRQNTITAAMRELEPATRNRR